jgi:hypothetical protein
LPYSIINRKFVKTKVEYQTGKLFVSKHENIYLLQLDDFNELIEKNYKSINELLKNPLSFDEELNIRSKILQNQYSLSPVIILQNIKINRKIQLYLDAHIYQDTREHLVNFR